MTQVRPEDLKEGDEVSLSVDARVYSVNGNHYTIQTPMGAVFLTPGSNVTITRLPPKGRRLEVGEEVLWPRVNGDGAWTVRAVVADQAWIHSDIPYEAVAPIVELSRPCGTPITVD